MAEIVHDILEKWSVFADNSHKNDCNNILAMETEREICLLKDIVSEWRVAASLELVHRSTVVMQAILRRRAAALYTRTAVLRPACITLQCAYRCRLSRISAVHCLIHTLTNDAPGVRPAYAKYVDLLNFWRQRALAPLLHREDARQQELRRDADELPLAALLNLSATCSEAREVLTPTRLERSKEAVEATDRRRIRMSGGIYW